MFIEPKKIIFMEDRELHFFSEEDNGVVVTWNVHYKSTTRKGRPYIDFVHVIALEGGEIYESEDCFIDGGLTAKEAKKLIQDLSAAVEYIELLDKVAHE